MSLISAEFISVDSTFKCIQNRSERTLSKDALGLRFVPHEVRYMYKKVCYNCSVVDLELDRVESASFCHLSVFPIPDRHPGHVDLDPEDSD